MYRERDPLEASGPAMTPAGATARRPAVLVLDDSAAQRKLLLTLLQRWGYEAVASGDPGEALELARDPRIGLIVSDWMMPGMTGPEFCRRLRETGREGYQYVVLLTSKSETSDLSEGLAAGADDFLTKPVSAPELRARLNAGARIVTMQGELVEKTRSLGNALLEIRKLYDAIDADLEEARRLQRSLLRDRTRKLPGAEISLWLKASGHVGGDMVGFFEAAQDKLGFYALDVSGHGVAAAMVVARAAGMLSDGAPEQNVALSAQGGGLFTALPPDLVAARLNRQLLSELKNERYLTLCLGFLDRRTGVVRMVQAGHPNPLILRRSGEVELVGSGGMPVGLFQEAQFEAFSFRLAAGDRLLLYSDGLTESPAPHGAFLDEDGLIRICRRHADLDGQALLSAIATDLERHMGGSDFPDDVSALLVSYGDHAA
ncbi:SpoIIE family protein phosphatase [Roseibacterium sp. SDUM158017]|uniref:PP2C family protein-serine/threonine phosphatase n=1 Tax=Roseicyclus salinarum TaxID=3036773 RepID=UPI0024150EC9|nr:SpoIIE family protein phosphatase [Roseibacterium sp. SDUM158017]MDG4646878.1 SpoIIE family protein phosphatase [Roseibacterium sp. SDUM158017]